MARPTTMMPGLLDRIRTSCAAVADRAKSVNIDHDRLGQFASEMDLAAGPADPGHRRQDSAEATAAFVMTLDSINFGSGYFPYIRKRPGMSGYHTVAASLQDHFDRRGPLSAADLRNLDAADCCSIFDQDPNLRLPAELMSLFAVALNDLGTFIATNGAGSFVATIEAAAGDAEQLVEMLGTMPFFRDVHRYDNLEVALYKRAQITAHDLWVTFEGTGPGALGGIERLTMFADNLVPHVLRVEGVLIFSDELLDRIKQVDNIDVGSPPEVEIRACALHAVELLAPLVRLGNPGLTVGQIDNILWKLGGSERFKAIPRHRSRTVFY